MTVRFILLAGLCCLLSMTGIAQSPDESIEGAISDDVPFTAYAINVTEADQTLTVNMETIDGDLDTLVYLLDATGNIIAENDDRASGNTDSRLIFPQINIGDYTVIATRYNVIDGRSSGTYRLNIDLAPPPAETRYPVTPADLQATGFPALDPRPVADWTILAYYGGDTDLERGILNDFNEFELAGGSDERVRVIALVDRSPGFTTIDGDWRNARLYEIEADVTGDHEINFPPMPDSRPIAELPELNTADGLTLAQFLVWGIQAYPAEQYAISFASHGAGWQGLIQDDTSQAILSLPELQRAFEVASAETGVDRFDMLINDACLMSSVEYHQAMAEFFPLSLASPEIIVDPALDMTLFTQLLRDPSMTSELGIARDLIDTYMQRDIQDVSSSLAGYLTHAVTDLDKFDAVTQAVNDFAAVVNASPRTYSTIIGSARTNAYTYSFFLDDTTRIDLGSFMQGVRAVSDDPDLNAAAQAVLTALDEARLYASAGATVAGRISYYNIYFPADGSEFRPEYLIDSPLTEWGLMLRNFYTVVTPEPWSYELTDVTALLTPADAPDTDTLPTVDNFHVPIVPDVTLSSVYPQIGSVQRPFNIQAELVGRNIATATYFIDRQQSDRNYRRYAAFTILTADFNPDGSFDLINDWRSGVDLVTLVDDTNLPVISDGTQTNNEFVTITDEVASLQGRYRETSADDWRDATVVFDFAVVDALAEGVGAVQQVIAVSDNGAAAPIQIADGATFQAYRYDVTPDGRTVRVPGNSYTWSAERMSITVAPAPSGDYQIGVEVTTYGGVSGRDTIDVQIDNDNIDPDKQSEISVDVGFDVRFPAQWAEMEYLPQSDIYVTSDQAGTTGMIIVPMYEGTNDLQAITEAFLATSFGGALQGAPTTTTIDERSALAFTYTGDLFGATWQIQARTVTNEVTDSELVFAVLGAPTDADFDQRAQTIFDDVRLVTVGNTRQWSYEPTDDTGLVQLPVPLSWQVDAVDDGVTFYYPPASANDADTFVGVFSQVLDTQASVDRVLETINDIARRDWIGSNETYTINSTQTYFGSYATWEATLYDAINKEIDLTGRVYTSVFETDGGIQVIAIWAETKAENTDFIYNILEPMVDGMQVID